jgi:hypothetical protein
LNEKLKWNFNTSWIIKDNQVERNWLRLYYMKWLLNEKNWYGKRIDTRGAARVVQ